MLIIPEKFAKKKSFFLPFCLFVFLSFVLTFFLYLFGKNKYIHQRATVLHTMVFIIKKGDFFADDKSGFLIQVEELLYQVLIISYNTDKSFSQNLLSYSIV